MVCLSVCQTGWQNEKPSLHRTLACQCQMICMRIQSNQFGGPGTDWFHQQDPSISTSHLHIATATLSLSDQSNLAQTITGNHWHYFVSPQLHNNDWDWETWGGILYSWLDTDWILICEMRSSSSSSSHQPSPYKARPMLSCQGLAAKPAHFLNQKVGAGRLMKKKTICGILTVSDYI